MACVALCPSPLASFQVVTAEPSAAGVMPEASGFSQATKPEETPPGDCAKLTVARIVTHSEVKSVFIVFVLFRLDRAFMCCCFFKITTLSTGIA